MRPPNLLKPLFEPLEAIKDQSVLKARFFAGALIVGHPFYYWAWTELVPQPYESPELRAVAALLGLIALIVSFRAGPDDRVTSFWFGVATAGGSVGLGSWFYVANGGNTVWLASLCVLILLFATITDWRLAFVATVLSLILSAVFVPDLGIGVWASGSSQPVFGFAESLTIGFSIVGAVLTRYSDVSMRSVRMRSQMKALAVTAHEIRTPIAGMLLLSEALEERLKEAISTGKQADLHEAHALTKDLVTSCRDANELVSTYLANANPSKPFATSASVSLAAVARDAIESVQRAHAGRGPRIELEVARDFAVLADRVALRLILVNLLNNARNATRLRHRAQAMGQIRVALSMDGSGRVTVTDNGIGMSRARLAKIFRPFYTSEPETGHGLGLTFVEAASKAYGAQIHVESQEGVGTSITLEFKSARTL